MLHHAFIPKFHILLVLEVSNLILKLINLREKDFFVSIIKAFKRPKLLYFPIEAFISHITFFSEIGEVLGDTFEVLLHLLFFLDFNFKIVK